MTALKSCLNASASQLISAVDYIVPAILEGRIVSRRILNAAMGQAFGTGSANGVWSQRDSFQMLEIATLKALPQLVIPTEPAAALEALADLERRLPTQTVRSEDQVNLQHFSTPLTLAWFAARLAAFRGDDQVLEPSAGTGMLAIWARQAARLHLNEIDPLRQTILRQLFQDSEVTGFDAVRIGSHLAVRPSVVLMNPPFARNAAGQEDAAAAARHLASALGVLRPNGRLVAIMPDNFSLHGRRAEVFQRALYGASVIFHARIEGAFRRQGTSIPIRLLVIEKRPGAINVAVINRASVADLVPFLDDMTARCQIEEDDRPAVPASTRNTRAPALFGGFRSKTAALSKPTPATASNDVVPLAYSLRDTIADAEQAVGVYVAYRPQRLIFADAADHPTALVESAAMASVALPSPSYVPLLPAKVIREQVLSRAQLETLVHALEATSADMPGRYRVPDRGLELVPDAEGAIYRRGFFLGDGTGAGKGRQLASILMDQWLRGSRRHLWISESNALLEDARRDWQALGGKALDIQSLSKIKPDARIHQSDGILFASYATLRSGTGERTRLQQLLEWLGEDFDGVILFDEAHAMGGVAGGEGRFGATKGSQQGIVGVELQNRLPRARVIYASATGASDVNNLAYATRLGLWGEGTAFPDRTSFIGRIREGGIAAMELVARELKAMGVYTARALSYAGVEYDILEHALTPRQIADFDTYADAWAIIHRNMEAALGVAGVTDPLEGKTLNGQALSAARSRFEGSKQRFFGQLLLSMKLPSLLPAIDEALASEHSVVIQLVSTAEALLDRRLADLSADDRAELNLDLSPREIVQDFLANAFPTRAMESYWDEDGNERSRPMVDEAGNPVHSEDALRIRAETIELLGALPPIVPALDAVIARFGTDAVAEITGRTRRLVTLPDGSQRLESRTPTQSLADANSFMGGTKRILVFSDAGGTGRSYHASLDCRNQQRRMHFLLEPGWRADRAIQGLGRTNRTHQASAPIFRPVTTDCRGERRFISTIARRLDSLGALTRGQRQTGGQNLFDPADNLESGYAREALTRWYHLLHQGKLASIGFADFCERTGLKLEQDGALTDNLPPIQRWLNRILALPIALQNAVFDEFLGLVEARIDAARKAGTFDAGVETLVADKLAIAEERVLREDANGASTQLLTIVAQWAPSVTALADVSKRVGDKTRFLRNGRSSRVALLVPGRTRLMDDGTPVTSYSLHRPGGRSLITADELAESHWGDCDHVTFDEAWQAEADDLVTRPYTERFYLATGRLLPIWNLLGDDAQVRRLVTQDGRSLLGRIVPAEAVNTLLEKLGIGDRVALTPEQVINAALGGKVVPIDLLFGVSLKRSRVNGEPRLEVLGFDPRALASWKARGCFTEIIAYLDQEATVSCDLSDGVSCHSSWRPYFGCILCSGADRHRPHSVTPYGNQTGILPPVAFCIGFGARCSLKQGCVMGEQPAFIDLHFADDGAELDHLFFKAFSSFGLRPCCGKFQRVDNGPVIGIDRIAADARFARQRCHLEPIAVLQRGMCRAPLDKPLQGCAKLPIRCRAPLFVGIRRWGTISSFHGRPPSAGRVRPGSRYIRRCAWSPVHG